MWILMDFANKSWNYQNITNIVRNWNIFSYNLLRLYWQMLLVGNIMVMKLRAHNVEVTLPITKVNWNILGVRTVDIVSW